MELGVMGFMNAALGFLFLAIVYLSSLIRPGLCDAARRYGQRESASIRGKCQPPHRHFLARRERARPHGKGSLRYNRPFCFPDNCLSHDGSRVDTAKKNVAVLATCQALLFTNNSTAIALNGLAGYALAANKALATLPVTAW